MRRSRGYILVATLVLLALMALVAGRLASRIDLLRDQSSTLASLAEGNLAAANARSEVLFAMVTQPISLASFGSGRQWPMDGEAIALANGVNARIQDHRGLLSLNAPDPGLIGRLLVAHGIPAARIDGLIDTLNDYTDLDNFRRLNGAEREEYSALGLLPPRNDFVDSPEELRQIIGWRDYPEVLQRVIPLLSSQRDGTFNVNTAPREVLAALLPGAAPSQLEALIARRKLAPFVSAADVMATAGFPLATRDEAFYPGLLYRIRLEMPGLPLALEYNVLLTPESEKRPWYVIDSRTVNVPRVPKDGSDERGRSPAGPAEIAGRR